MAIAFPSNPTTNQIFTANNNSWRWNGEYWKSQTGAASVYISDTAPATPVVGTLWFNSVSGKTFVYYSDADSVQWIEVGGTTAASSSNNSASQYTTSNLAEGSNLYYTTARATAAARAAISVTGTGGNYNSSTGVITLPYTVLTSINGQTGAVTLTTSNVAEGTNLYYTDARARAAISVTGSGSYDSATGIITVSAAAVPKITGVAVTDSGYAALDDTAISTAGGYIKITGTGFVTGCQVLIGTVSATSVGFVSSTEVRAQLPATAAGTYILYLVNPDGSVAIRVNAVTFSTTPVWSTGSTLPNGTSGSPISIQLAASSDSTITYALAIGSTLPSALTLSTSGLLSGTVSGLAVDTTYNFTVVANDVELQDSPRTFSLTVVAATVPAAPTIGTATVTGQTSATVTFTAPENNGGRTIISYTATSSPGGVTGTLSQAGSGTITVTGLTAGTPYTFTVYATNSVGNSASSNSSNQITTNQAAPTSVEYLVVAGGGGGGGASGGRGGGGGAGGMLASTLSVSASTAYTVTVGGGGPGSNLTAGRGSNGTTSQFASISTVGGGGGAGDDGGGIGYGSAGGSGGGGHYDGAGGAGTAGQGNNGGAGITSPNFGSGGGGGAGAVGQSGQTTKGGDGGIGNLSSITGTSTYYAGGGGGQLNGGTAGSGGAGGGGTGNGQNPGGGNLGGGGGGNGSGGTAGQGGSGVVIIAYPNTFLPLSSISGGLSYDQPTRSGYRVYRFTNGTGPISW